MNCSADPGSPAVDSADATRTMPNKCAGLRTEKQEGRGGEEGGGRRRRGDDEQKEKNAAATRAILNRRARPRALGPRRDEKAPAQRGAPAPPAPCCGKAAPRPR